MKFNNFENSTCSIFHPLIGLIYLQWSLGVIKSEVQVSALAISLITIVISFDATPLPLQWQHHFQRWVDASTEEFAVITMQNRIIEWSHEDQFASANLNRVELFEINGKRTLTLKGSHELPSQVSCISCNTQRGIVAVGQQSGNVSFVYGDTSAGVSSASFGLKEDW